MKVLSTYKRISLWLIPPEPILSSLVCTQQQLISLHMMSSSSSSGGGDEKRRQMLPSFTPHVTLVGGIPISECCTIDDDLQHGDNDSNNHYLSNNSAENKAKAEDEKKVEQDVFVEEEEDVDEVAAKSVLKRLAFAFRNFGGVDCHFVKERGVFAARRPHKKKKVAAAATTNDLDNNNHNIISDDSSSNNDEEEGEVQWNQSCISIMKRTDGLAKAMELADQALFATKRRATASNNKSEQSSSSQLERHFKPPACEPHYSFVYGNDADLITSLQPPPSSSSSGESQSSSSSITSSSRSSSSGGGKNTLVLECPPNFTSTEIAVIWTYPSTLEGVEQWREIGRFSLVEGVSKY